MNLPEYNGIKIKDLVEVYDPTILKSTAFFARVVSIKKFSPQYDEDNNGDDVDDDSSTTVKFDIIAGPAQNEMYYDIDSANIRSADSEPYEFNLILVPFATLDLHCVRQRGYSHAPSLPGVKARVYPPTGFWVPMVKKRGTPSCPCPEYEDWWLILELPGKSSGRKKVCSTFQIQRVMFMSMMPQIPTF